MMLVTAMSRETILRSYSMDKREKEIVGGEPDEGEELPEKKPRNLYR